MNERYLFFCVHAALARASLCRCSVLLWIGVPVTLCPAFWSLCHRAEAHTVGKSIPGAKLDFSHIDSQTSESTYQGFLNNVKFGIKDFLTAYHFCFAPEDEAYILAADSPTDFRSCSFGQLKRRQREQQTNFKRDLLIDEYDHFANELVAFRLEEFKTSVSRNGFVRKFYEAIKTATGDGVVDGIFITGVSPLTLDSLTSGFNIRYTPHSRFLQFHNMMGFTEQEVEEILVGIGAKESILPLVIHDMRQWYNGYLFSSKAESRLYNPDMVPFLLLPSAEAMSIPKNCSTPILPATTANCANFFVWKVRKCKTLLYSTS